MTQSSPDGTIEDVYLSDALSERYLSYALSTIVARSLPDVRDGLKPVHRRLLYAMRQLKLDPTSGFKKCARVVGDVIGKYHPHGDAAVYDALVRLAQDFAVRYALVDGQGNFGNIDGDNAAAMRYTEARLTEVAEALLDGIDEDSVDFRFTYDGEEEEPVVLPARFPNLLANGASGIAVGMATNIPPHNIGELCKALRHLISHPNASIDKLIDLVPGPDFPTGGILVEPRQNIIEAYRTGRGSLRLRARWEVEKLGQGAYQIVITEIPYQVQKSRLIERVAELLATRKLQTLDDIRDESTEAVRIVIEPRSRTVDPAVLMEQLFRQTEMEVRVGLNVNVLDADNTPRLMNLRDTLQAYLDHRHEVLVRRSHYRLRKIESRLEVLDGLLIVYLNLDEIIRIVREEDEPKAVLMQHFGVNDIQADAILSMRLRQLRKLEEIAIRTEYQDLSNERSKIDTLLHDEKSRWKSIAAEIAEIEQQFGPDTNVGRRRTAIRQELPDVVVPLSVTIEREPITVVCSEKGWIRSIKGHTADSMEIRYKEGDRSKFVIHTHTTEKLVMFATNGRFYTLGCDRLPGGRGHGEPIRLMVDLPDRHELIACYVHSPGRRLLIASDRGRGFVVEENETIAQTRNGKQVLIVGADEEAAACATIGDTADRVAVVGSNRKLVIFGLDELPTMAKGRGVILQRYKNAELCDVQTFDQSQGLTWRSGSGVRTETNLDQWAGKRGQVGQKAPRGFPLSNRFA
jgi:topoisomerase-4 subunit A